MKKLLQTMSLALLLLCGASTARADVKIKTRNTSAGQTSEGVTYIKGKRQRTEQNETSVTITQCDLRRNIQLGVPTKTYMVSPFDQNTDASSSSSAAKPSSAAGTTTAARRGGIVTSTFTSTDTGERKKMFGYMARRIKTSIQTESSPDACQVNRTRMETDGWYIDAQFALDCDYGMAANSYVPPTQAGGCRDEYRTKQIGVAKLGYPVSVTTTLFDDKGQASFTFSQEVVEITNAVLDSALFEAPADYRQVNDMREMYSAAAMSAAAGNSNDGDDTNENATNSSNSGASRMNAGVGAKREGVVRVGVAMTETGLTGENVNAAALAEAVRGALMSNLNNSTIEVVALAASGTQELESEAKQKECDFVLHSTVAHKKGGGGGFGGFLKKSASIANDVMSPSAGGAKGNAANSLKAKDELTLEYRLQRGAESVVANTLKAKAKSDGDDLISQLTGQAAVAVRAAVATKK